MGLMKLLFVVLVGRELIIFPPTIFLIDGISYTFYQQSLLSVQMHIYVCSFCQPNFILLLFSFSEHWFSHIYDVSLFVAKLYINSLFFCVNCSQDMNVYAACDAYSQETTTMEQHVCVVFLNTCVKRKLLNAFIAVVKDAPVAINLSLSFFCLKTPHRCYVLYLVRSGLCTLKPCLNSLCKTSILSTFLCCLKSQRRSRVGMCMN